MAVFVRYGENMLAERLHEAQAAEVRLEIAMTDTELSIIEQGQQITELELMILERSMANE